jgi:hypothetical protein
MAITAEEFDGWLSPAEALQLLKVFPAETAQKAILDRLKANLIKPVAKNGATRFPDKPLIEIDMPHVPASFWQHVHFDGKWVRFWKTGDISAYIRSGRASGAEMGFFDMRFLRSDIEKLLPKDTSNQQPQTATTERKTEETKGPNVSPAYLQEWSELFLKVYPSAEVTLDRAWSSAKGMFPGKSVSRDAVDKLLPPRGRGRRKLPTAN